MPDFTGFTPEPIEEIIRDCGYGKKKGGGGGGSERFQDTDLFREIQGLTDTTSEELTEDNIMEISASKSAPDEEEDAEKAVPENK